MKNLKYQGYSGSIAYSNEDTLFYGKILNIKSLISYEGAIILELEANFKTAIVDYLTDCKLLNLKLEKPF